jgi:predicted RNase H-like HicB family nuclease
MPYVAFIHKDTDSAFGVSFPDVCGCFSAGDTLEEARQNAAEALAAHIDWLVSDGDPVPEPRSLDNVAADPALAADRGGAILVVIPFVRKGLAD